MPAASSGDRTTVAQFGQYVYACGRDLNGGDVPCLGLNLSLPNLSDLKEGQQGVDGSGARFGELPE